MIYVQCDVKHCATEESRLAQLVLVFASCLISLAHFVLKGRVKFQQYGIFSTVFAMFFGLW